MKKILTAPVQMWHVILVTIIVASLTSTMAVSAAASSALLPVGSVQMALAQVNPGPDVVDGTSNVVVLKQTITIPAGKVADLVAFSEVDIQGGSAAAGYEYCFGQYRLDNSTTGTVFKPGNYILKGFSPPDANNLSVPINGYLPAVKAGTHTIYMVMGANYQDCIINMGSMVIFANIR